MLGLALAKPSTQSPIVYKNPVLIKFKEVLAIYPMLTIGLL
jgi:hypothetical protein